MKPWVRSSICSESLVCWWYSTVYFNPGLHRWSYQCAVPMSGGCSGARGRTYFNSVLSRLNGCGYFSSPTPTFPLLVLDEFILSIPDWCTAWGSFWTCSHCIYDWEALFKGWSCVPLVSLPWPGNLLGSYSYAGHFTIGWLQYAQHGTGFEEHLEATTGTKCSGTNSNKCFLICVSAAIWSTLMTSWVRYKLSVITFMA